METLMLDTCFLIDQQRELRRKEPGSIYSFLKRNERACFVLSTVAWGEFLAGFPSPQHPAVMAVRARVELVGLTEITAEFYGKLYRNLKDEGSMIGSNDLWIAATAMAHSLPLVTCNHQVFSRLKGLELVSY